MANKIGGRAFQIAGDIWGWIVPYLPNKVLCILRSIGAKEWRVIAKNCVLHSLDFFFLSSRAIVKIIFQMRHFKEILSPEKWWETTYSKEKDWLLGRIISWRHVS